MSGDQMHPVAKATLGYANGHWWKQFAAAEPPTYYHELDTRTRDEIPPEHREHVPEKIDWTDYAAYHCRYPRCNDPCINRVDSPYSLTKTCRACYAEADLDDLRDFLDDLPDWADDLDLDHRQPATEDETILSKGTPEGNRPTDTPTHDFVGVSASSETTASEDHRERPPAMGVRPRTGAHPPNPAGEGESSAGAVCCDEHQPSQNSD